MVAGPKPALAKVFSIIQELGPPLGLFINAGKCELFGLGDLSSFSPLMKKSSVPNFEVLGAPIGDLIFCAKCFAHKCADASMLLEQLEDVGAVDPQVALILLRQCGGFCKLVHLARSTPPALIGEALQFFDDDVRHCFSECTAIDTPNVTWQQAQLSLSRGGLGLRSLSEHSSAAYISSLSASGVCSSSCKHLAESIKDFNELVSSDDALVLDHLDVVMHQRSLSGKIEDRDLSVLLDKVSLPDKAHLLSISSPHAAAWLSVIPSLRLNLHLEPAEFQIAVKWWLGIAVTDIPVCSFCPSHALAPLGHHALTCKHGGDVVSRHNRLRDVLLESCRLACFGPQAEAGSGLEHEGHRTRPADILISHWDLGKPAALDLTVTSTLNSSTLLEAGVTSGSAALAAEVRKHNANDAKCSELGWTCIPIAVETYGCWGAAAMQTLSRLASHLATRGNCSKSHATCLLYGRLSLILMRANARALLSRAGSSVEDP